MFYSGHRCQANVWLARGLYKLSLLLGADFEGPVAYNIVFGSCTATEFVDFMVNYIIPRMNQWPAPRSVLFLDSHRTHANQSFVDLINDWDILCIKFPFYKPYWNLAEWFFNAIKSIIKFSPNYYDNTAIGQMNAIIDAVEMTRGCDWSKPIYTSGMMSRS